MKRTERSLELTLCEPQMAFFLKGASEIGRGAFETLDIFVCCRVILQVAATHRGHVQPVLMVRMSGQQGFCLLTTLGETPGSHGRLNVFEQVGRDLWHGVSRWVSE